MNTSETKNTPSTLNVNQLLLDALDKRWKNYRAELKRCRAEFSNEAVHDLRIAARRMLAIIQLLNSISPRPRLQKLNRAFKDQLDEFDDLRDTQVILAEISETIQELPQLQKFQYHLQSVEEDLLKALRKKLKVIDLFDVSKRIRKTRESLEAKNDDELALQTIQAVDDAFLITKQRHGWIDSAQPATIHRVRIAFKTFRYMVEIIHPLLKEYPLENLKRMNDYQSLMGEIQDVEVIMQTLADFPSRANSFDHEPVRRYYERRHAEATSAFIEDMNEIDTFWRPAPDQPFPWEK
ncbi:MAG: CHAD domain-containing protein [Anaerolineae bacterium]|nr:CHAD domain-containing protein [Anaerolineae bacterium]MCI0611150.1 CHAD domain-containing protein [Anaerolineae bacterium]